MGVALHADVVLSAGCRQAGVGLCVVTIGRAAASLLRGWACGVPAVIDVGPLWSPHCVMVPFRRFAFGSPAVIESSPPMGAPASRCALGRGGHSTHAADDLLPCTGMFLCPHRGFLTRRIDYFRALVPSLANTQKSEIPHFQTHPSDVPPQRRRRCRISPPCVTNCP